AESSMRLQTPILSPAASRAEVRERSVSSYPSHRQRRHRCRTTGFPLVRASNATGQEHRSDRTRRSPLTSSVLFLVILRTPRWRAVLFHLLLQRILAIA